MLEPINLKIVFILTIGFGFASILGYLSFRAKLSPILGYLIAGYLIGPYSPGFVADKEVAEQLAEIGVILMMFSVGLHFKWQDLMKFKRIAIPGAIAQTGITTILCALLLYSIGWTIESGIVIGLAIGVASTMVLVRILHDNELLHTPEGHIAVGWLIVEDMITIAALLLIPPLAESMSGESFPIKDVAISFGFALLKFVVLAVIMFTLGRKIVSYVLNRLMLTNSSELFTLTVLSITFVIAVGSAVLLGTSIALGAFIAGMVISQTKNQEEVSMRSKSLKDTFVVIFFLSVGMLFNPAAIAQNFFLFIIILAIILIAKPLVAYGLTLLLRYPQKTALTVAIALAQIGEFSFILAERAMKFNILPEGGYDVIVACALVSISLNPLLFGILKKSFESRHHKLSH